MRALVLCSALLLLASGCDRRVGAGTPANDSDASTPQVTRGATSDATAATSQGPDVDNSAINSRDRLQAAPTPLDQGQGQDDINITATIRRRVVEQPLSLNAHNVKIITQNGKVTLRGPVKNSEEKAQIEKIAAEVAGQENVSNLLDVAKD